MSLCSASKIVFTHVNRTTSIFKSKLYITSLVNFSVTLDFLLEFFSAQNSNLRAMRNLMRDCALRKMITCSDEGNDISRSKYIMISRLTYYMSI